MRSISSYSARSGLLLAVLSFLIAPMLLGAEEGPVRRIAFGSCAKESKAQPIWEAVLATKPELFLFLGDNIYGDTHDMKVLKSKYEKLAAIPGYQRLKQSCRILATWDDHDYGWNDAGAEYPEKRESQQIFLDFFGEPADSARRKQEGIYDAKLFGPAGQRVQIILLDTRYFRSPLKKADPLPPRGVGPYIPNTDPAATLLGEAQWKWLEEQLRQPAQVRILCSSIQVVSEEHGWEKWMNIPHERDRLYKLIRDTKANGVIFLSGDRHLADLSVMDGGVGYPLFDVTVSGLTEAFQKHRPVEQNRHRLGGMNWGNHFGFIAIDWYRPDPVISLQIRDEEGDIRVQHKLPLSLLQQGDKTTGAGATQRVPTGQATAGTTPPVKTSAGTVSTAEAAKMVGQEVTVEFQVKATGGSGNRLFLNSETDFRSPTNFTIVLEKAALEELAGQGITTPRDHFPDKTVQVKGKVDLFRDKPQIKVTKAAQIKLAGT